MSHDNSAAARSPQQWGLAGLACTPRGGRLAFRVRLFWAYLVLGSACREV